MMHSGFNPDHLPPGIEVETSGTIVPVVFTAWGRHDWLAPNTLVKGADRPRFGDGSLDPDCEKCFWTIEGTDWNDVLRQYHELQGWEPHRPDELADDGYPI